MIMAMKYFQTSDLRSETWKKNCPDSATWKTNQNRGDMMGRTAERQLCEESHVLWPSRVGWWFSNNCNSETKQQIQVSFSGKCCPNSRTFCTSIQLPDLYSQVGKRSVQRQLPLWLKNGWSTCLRSAPAISSATLSWSGRLAWQRSASWSRNPDLDILE